MRFHTTREFIYFHLVEPFINRVFIFPVVFCLFALPTNVVGTTSISEQSTVSQKHPTIIVAIDKEYKPFEFVDAYGRASGFAPAILREIGPMAGFDFQFKAMNWPDALAALEQGDVALLSMIFTPERKEKYQFSIPHSRIGQAIFCRKKGPHIISFAELKGHKVALQKDDISFEMLKDRVGVDIVKVSSKEEGFLLLHAKKVDAFLTASYPGIRFIRDYNFDTIVIGALNIFPQDFCFVAKLGKTQLISSINKALTQLKHDGRYKAIRNQWLTYEVDKKSWFEKHSTILQLLGVVFISFLVIILFRNQFLHRLVSKRSAELKESELLYRTLVENIECGISLIDKDHRIVMTNTTQAKYFNRPPDSFHRKLCHQEFEEREEVCPHCPGVKALETNKVSKAIVSGSINDEPPVTVRISAFPLTGSGKYQGCFIEMVEDITLQMKTEEKLAGEKERLAVTLQSIGDGVICTDTSGIITLFNKMAEELTGWKAEYSVGRQLNEVFQVLDSQNRELCENPVQKVLNSGNIVVLGNHSILINKNGRELIIADTAAPIRDQKSRIVGVVLVFRDETSKSQQEAEMLKASKLEAVGVLAGGIAHDFNNILTAILGNINIALFDSGLEDDTRSLLTEAEKASFRAKGLTQQLLTFSRGGEPVKETAALQDVIRESATFVLHGSKVDYRYQFCEELWPVSVDRGQISQVIQNMVLNARQAMPDGGIVMIHCKNIPSELDRPPSLGSGDYVKVEISDSGIGIPVNALDRIFDPYFSTKQEGSGLGLAICHSIVNKHDGQIFVESEPGKGTSFTIYLPASNKVNEGEVKKVVSNIPCRQAKILIMDDEGMVRKVARNMLARMGHTIVEAADGDEAIKLYNEAEKDEIPFDLILMDLTIPGQMGGKEAVKEILTINPEAKVICSSGYSTDPVLAHYREYGFCHAIAKPYQFQELNQVVADVLNQ